MSTTVCLQQLGEAKTSWSRTYQENVGADFWPNSIHSVNRTGGSLEEGGFLSGEVLEMEKFLSRVYAVLSEAAINLNPKSANILFLLKP